MGALVNHVQPVVAPVLLHRKIAGIAITAVNLDRKAVGFQAPFTGPTFGNGGQHFQQQAGIIRRLRRARVLLVNQPCTVKLKRKCTLAVGFLRQQHSPDIGMFDDPNLHLAGILDSHPTCTCRFDGATLQARFGVRQRGVIARKPEHGRCCSNADSCFVHHVKHTAKPF